MFPNDAATGFQLARQGRYDEALPYLENANRTAPTDVRLLHATADLLQRAGRGLDAANRYQITASLLPNDMDVLTGWARVLLTMGATDRALDPIDRALMRDPGFAGSTGALEVLLRETTDTDTACVVLEQLVERHPDHPELLGQYAMVLLDGERPLQARKVLEQLAQLQTGDPVPHVELARLAVGRGDLEAARAHLQAALSADPDCAAALWERAQIDGWLLDADALAHVQALSRSAQDTTALVSLHDILAHHQDRKGDFAAASVSFREANAAMAAVASAQPPYDGQRHAMAIDTTLRNQTAQLFARLRGAGSDSQRPVFVIGLPRSGTTLLEQMLASHPLIAGVGEQPLAIESLKRATGPTRKLRDTLGHDVIAEASAWHLDMLDRQSQRRAAGRSAQRIVDKMPDNYLLVGWLRIAFPRATILHCQRDPRDVALSCWQTQFANVRWNFDLGHIVHRIEQHRRLMRHWQSTVGEQITLIRYENLVADPGRELGRAVAATGLEWHPDVLDAAKRDGFVASASMMQVRESLNARSVGRWQNYKDVLAPVLPRLEAIVAQDAIDAAEQ